MRRPFRFNFSNHLETRRSTARPFVSGLSVMLWWLLSILSMLSSSNVHAGGPSPVVVYDSNGMPRCIADGTGRDALIFFWDESTAYPKPVYAATISQMQLHLSASTDSRDCSLWPDYRRAVQTTGGTYNKNWIVEPASAANGIRVGTTTYKWGGEAEARLAQVRRGANVAHPGLNAAEFLALQPIGDYTRDVNRRLTSAYGAGFSGDIYKEWLAHQPGNAALRSKIDATIERVQKYGTNEISKRLKGYKIMIAEGYMQSPTSDRLHPLIDVLHSLGGDVVTMSSDTVGSMAPNADSFEMQLGREFSNGSSVIVISASKGAPEVLTALANLAAKNPQYQRQIAAVITMAGMVDGSFLVDWADRFPVNLFIKSVLDTGAERAQLKITNLQGFFDMSTETLAKQADIYRKRLPALPYYNFVGVLTGDGLAKDTDIRMLQEKLSIPHVAIHGANDGYIEYPGTRFPRSWGLRSRDVVFDASHAILDGSFDGHSMSDANASAQVTAAIFQVLLDDAATMPR